MKNQKGFSLIGMVIALVIVALLCYASIKFYFGGSAMDKKMEKTLTKQGIDTTSSKSMIDSARKKAGEVNKKFREREKQLQKTIQDKYENISNQ